MRGLIRGIRDGGAGPHHHCTGWVGPFPACRLMPSQTMRGLLQSVNFIQTKNITNNDQYLRVRDVSRMKSLLNIPT